MNGMNEERFHELKDAYALGALAEAEREEFERYLADHPQHQSEIDELGGVAGMLAFAPAEHEPSPELRQRVVDAVEAEARLPRAARLRPAGRRPASARTFALAAAAALLVGLLSWNVLLQGEVQDLQGQVADARAQVEQAESANPASGTETIDLRGSWAEQGTNAEVATIEGNRVILVEDLPSVPAGRTCQVWVIRDEVPRPSGLFDPSGSMAAAAVTTPLHEGDTIAVTVEPAGGSDQPTSDPVLHTDL